MGVYPDVTLNDARQRRDEARALLASGIDPSDYAKGERENKRLEQERQKAAMRFFLDNDGALSFRLGSKALALTPSETAELRRFLNATAEV